MQIRKLPTLSAVSVFGFYRKCRHCRQFPYFGYTEIADIVGSFRILIINCKTHYFLCLRAENPNTELTTLLAVSVFGLSTAKRVFFAVSVPIIQIQKL